MKKFLNIKSLFFKNNNKFKFCSVNCRLNLNPNFNITILDLRKIIFTYFLVKKNNGKIYFNIIENKPENNVKKDNFYEIMEKLDLNLNLINHEFVYFSENNKKYLEYAEKLIKVKK